MPQKKVKKIASEIRKSVPENIENKEQVNQLLDDLESEDLQKLKKAIDVIPEFITKFEAQHPKLAESLNEIMVILSNMGI